MAASGDRIPGIPPAKPRRLRELVLEPRRLSLILVIALVATFTMFATVPVPQTIPFEYGGGSSAGGGLTFSSSFPQSLCPSGAVAVVAISSWGLYVTYGIAAPNRTSIWSQHSPYANASFAVPTCGTYQLVAAGSGDAGYIDVGFTIRGTLSYSAPLL